MKLQARWPNLSGIKGGNAGFSLVEVFIAAILLTIVVTGAIAYLVFGRADIMKAVHKKLALQAAKQRIEELKNASYASIEPPMPGTVKGSSAYYIVKSGSSWSLSSNFSADSVVLSQKSFALVTTVLHIDDDFADLFERIETQGGRNDQDGDGQYDEDGPGPTSIVSGKDYFGIDGSNSALDTDSDGYIAEDPPNGVDDDNDGQIDEDPDDGTSDSDYLKVVVEVLDTARNTRLVRLVALIGSG